MVLMMQAMWAMVVVSTVSEALDGLQLGSWRSGKIGPGFFDPYSRD